VLGTRAPATISWLEHAAAYAAMKWPLAAAHTRAGIADALATITPALHTPGRGRPLAAEVQAILAEVTQIRPKLTAFFGCLYYAALRPPLAHTNRERSAEPLPDTHQTRHPGTPAPGLT
jgi:hypothetical protein